MHASHVDMHADIILLSKNYIASCSGSIYSIQKNIKLES